MPLSPSDFAKWNSPPPVEEKKAPSFFNERCIECGELGVYGENCLKGNVGTYWCSICAPDRLKFPERHMAEYGHVG